MVLKSVIGFVNDSKATNPGATEVALKNLESQEQVILIIGGDTKGVDLNTLENTITQKVAGLVILASDPKPLIELGERCRIETLATSYMEEAVKEAYRLANLNAEKRKGSSRLEAPSFLVPLF